MEFSLKLISIKFQFKPISQEFSSNSSLVLFSIVEQYFPEKSVTANKKQKFKLSQNKLIHELITVSTSVYYTLDNETRFSTISFGCSFIAHSLSLTHSLSVG